MDKLKVGLIGFGSWTRNAYLPALKYDGRATVAAVTAASEKTRMIAGGMFGTEAVVYDSYVKLLNHKELDAVMIAVPDDIHQEILAAAIDSSIPVFYEPPIAVTREQIPVMSERILQAEQIIYANLELGFHPAIDRAIQILNSNAVGSLQNASIDLHAGWGSSYSELCLLNRMSCWYVSVLNRIIGCLPYRVLVLDGHGSPGRMQAVSTGIYDYNGIWGSFRANVNSPEELSIKLEIVGNNGVISVDYFTGRIRYRTNHEKEWIVESYPCITPYADWPGVRESVTAFLDSVIKKEGCCGNGKEVSQLNQIGLAAEESKDSGEWAWVNYR